jgi:hypothetical protein
MMAIFLFLGFVAPNNGDHHFSELFNVEETKGIIHSQIIPAIKALPKEP